MNGANVLKVIESNIKKTTRAFPTEGVLQRLQRSGVRAEETMVCRQTETEFSLHLLLERTTENFLS